jgi:putative flippase GtrA
VFAPTLVRYLLISAFTFVLDLALLTLVRSGLGWPLPVAVTIGYAVALSTNYLLNRVLTFRSHAAIGSETLRYAGAVAVNFGVVLLAWFVFSPARPRASTSEGPASRRSRGRAAR